MARLKGEIETALRFIVGLRLCLTKTTGNLRAFHFGEILRVDGNVMGEYALHVNCPWRIERGAGILTGSGDYCSRADDNEDPAWEVGAAWGTYQEQALRNLLRGIDAETGILVNGTEILVVERLKSDVFGGVKISLSGGYRLVLFPSGSRGEEWRLLPPGEARHFVVEAGEAYGGDKQTEHRKLL